MPTLRRISRDFLAAGGPTLGLFQILGSPTSTVDQFKEGQVNQPTGEPVLPLAAQLPLGDGTMVCRHDRREQLDVLARTFGSPRLERGNPLPSPDKGLAFPLGNVGCR